jgi:LCP family protein required for cell wall assembly
MHKKHKKSFIFLGLVFIVIAFFVFKTASFYPFIFHLLFDRSIALKETNNRVNVLLLGIGGGVHDGPNLTDTIIFASIDPKNNKVNLVSIPRDLWVPELTTYVKKINSAYSDGESKSKGGGLIEAKAIVRKVTGQEVDYGIRIDFSGFTKAIDTIGGLDINVDNTFDDYVYPISGKEDDSCGFSDKDIADFVATASAETDIQEKFVCRYKHLHFDQGITHMDGQLALEFVRSRHAIGIESGDFARSKRQEKVITAFKDKVFSAQTLINPAKIISLFNIVKDSIDTDIKQEEFDDFIRLAQKVRKAKIINSVIDVGDALKDRNGLLIETPIAPEYVYSAALIPRLGNGNYSEIQKFVACQINNDNCIVAPTPTVNK